MNEVDNMLAKAQVNLTKITLIGFLAMLFVLLLLLSIPGLKASPEIISLVSAATGSLATILTQQNGYFFARHRMQGIPTPPDDPTAGPAPASPTPVTQPSTSN